MRPALSNRSRSAAAQRNAASRRKPRGSRGSPAAQLRRAATRQLPRARGTGVPVVGPGGRLGLSPGSDARRTVALPAENAGRAGWIRLYLPLACLNASSHASATWIPVASTRTRKPAVYSGMLRSSALTSLSASPVSIPDSVIVIPRAVRFASIVKNGFRRQPCCSWRFIGRRRGRGSVPFAMTHVITNRGRDRETPDLRRSIADRRRVRRDRTRRVQRVEQFLKEFGGSPVARARCFRRTSSAETRRKGARKWSRSRLTAEWL